MQRPTNLSTDTKQTSAERVQRYNIDHIDLTQSPMQTHPRHFQPGTLFDAQTYERVHSNVYNSPNKIKEEQEEEDEDDNQPQDLHAILDQARQTEIESLSQLIDRDRPTTANGIGDILYELIRNVSKPTTASTLVNTDKRSQTAMNTPSNNQIGPIADRDRPYADYGHLDRQTIAQEFQFNLQPPTTTNAPSIRLNAKSFAITSWTKVSKELVMTEIKDEFGIENIQYICIGEEISELNHQRHLHIQIIFKEKINRRKPFLDEITQTHCNYQVTQNDRAWNEYIRKGPNYIEFGTYQSISTRGKKQWPSSSASASVSSSAPVLSSSLYDQLQLTRATTKTTTTMTTRAQAEKKGHIAMQAFQLAQNNVNHAMDHLQHAMPEKFLGHSNWYLTTCKYIHLRAQQDADRRGDIDKEYVWPLSFPDCTPQLREAINRWIRHHFSRPKRAKCLIIVGPTGTGKTSFALSLPGRVNYFKERWNLDKWTDYARYSVYDDIPWDEFKNFNYPSKKAILTQNGKMNATDKYRGTLEINVQQPAIVLLNREDAGSLLAEPITMVQKEAAEYWNKRAFVYIMGPGEYFHRRTTTKTNTAADSDDTQVSSNSSSGNEEARIGQLDEFDKMIQRYQTKHSK